jgi:hypothetical protein
MRAESPVQWNAPSALTIDFKSKPGRWPRLEMKPGLWPSLQQLKENCGRKKAQKAQT